MKTHTHKLFIFLLYFILICGGLWHVLGWFQNIMRISASPLIITLSIIISVAAFRNVEVGKRRQFVLWGLFVIVLGWASEFSGIHYQFPFGHYSYSNILQPQIFNVPLAIAFAWLSITLSSLCIADRLVQRIKLPLQNLQFVLLTPTLMVIFDMFMEYSALKLNYWTWNSATIPASNYITWFALGLLFSMLWKFFIRMRKTPNIAVHIYLAQLFYFIMILFKVN